MECFQDNTYGVTWYRFAEPGDRFHHACITRLGGISGPPFACLNLGGTVGDDPKAVEENHRRALAALGIAQSQVVSPHQVHRARVAEVGSKDGGRIIPATDALITRVSGVPLLMRFADCVPVLFYDSAHHAAGLAHAGWRGVAAEVVPATVRAMVNRFGSRTSELWAGVGPAIGADHYVVGREVVTAIEATLPHDHQIAELRDDLWHLDLSVAVHAQLANVGVHNVSLSGMCTACHTDEWYSHRAEAGKTGRFGVLAMLT